MIRIAVATMTSVELTGEQKKLIDKIAIENGFVEYQIESVSGSAKGDNYLGVITSVTIKEGEEQLKLILKSAHLGQIRNQVPIRQAYLREIFVYEKVFPEFEEFQEEFGLSDPFRSYAKLYGACDVELSECLVLEDLRATGFRLWNRKIPMDHDHLAAVIQEYARFHAVSLAMKEKKPVEFEAMTKSVQKHIFEEYFNDGQKTKSFVRAVMANVFKIFVDDPETTEILRRFEERLPDIFKEVYRKPDVVIVHGDCWCNNLMFDYQNQEEPTAPSAIRIIDWQLSKLGSPASDLAYFFLVHSPKHILYDYESYLKLYHETLSRNLREFHCDPEEVFPYSVLLEQWDKNVGIGVYTAFNILKMMMCDSEEAPDFSDVTDSGKNIIDVFDFTTKHYDAYSARIKYLIKFSIEKGFI